MTASASSNCFCTSPPRSSCGGFASGSRHRPNIGRSAPKTSATAAAPWYAAPAESKWFARLAVAKTAVKALGKGIKLGPPPLDPEVVKAAAVSLDHEERAALGLVESKQAKD